MAGFKALWQINEKMAEGKSYYTAFRKTPIQATSAGVWFDMSMSPGNPGPQYYAATPLEAQQMKLSTDGGIRHGGNVSPDSKFLSRFLLMATAATALPMPFILCDYLLFYPFVDTGTNDAQLLDNTATLPRFTDGKGVQIMAVSVASVSGSQPQFEVSYTNSDGVSGRTSRNHYLMPNTYNGAIMTKNSTGAVSHHPFMGLQDGDSGVRSIESVTFTSGTDTGLLAMVLVKPLLTGVLLEQTAATEIVSQPMRGQMPTIYDDAFLNLLVLPNGNITGIGHYGEIETIWN